MAQLQNLPATSSQGTRKVTQFKDHSKVDQVRKSNLIAAKSVADAVRTSLGPRGMDKMIQTAEGAVIITNDGATILKHMSVIHPAAKMLVDLSAAQDVEAGDGTTSVVVLCGALLVEAEKLLAKGIHPTIIAESFSQAAADAVKHLVSVAKPVDLKDRDTLIKAASTSLSSKVVSQYSSLLAPLSVDAVLKVVHDNSFVDLRDVKTVKKVGGTMEDTHLVEGVVLNQRIIKNAGGPVRVEKAKIGLIQFQLSPPKPDMDNNIVVNDYRQMDKILKEERAYLLNLCKIIKKSGCNVLLVQKSILRDAVTDLSLHFLSKLKIMVITDVEREEVDWLCRSLGCRPIADIDAFTEDKLATAEVVTEVESAGAKYVAVHGVKSPNTRKTASIVVHGANSLVVDEAERSIHDAMCVIRCLVKKGFLIAGGGAPEMEVSNKLLELSKTFTGLKGHCYESFSTAVQVIPTTLAENAGLAPLKIVSQLKKLHKKSNTGSGINVKRGTVEDMWSEDVIQPLLVSTSELELAADTVRMIMKIDDIVQAR